MTDSDATKPALEAMAYLLWLRAQGYLAVKLLDRERYAAVAPKMYTQAVIVGRIGDFDSIADGWCYPDFSSAKAALDAWDGRGEPEGWHRHPASGRRVAQSDGEFDDDGQPVRKGDLYRRG